MKLFKVVASIMAVGKHSRYELSIHEMDVRETQLNYNWKKNRLSKDEIGKVKHTHDGNSLICFQIYTLEDQVEDAKEKVTQSFKDWIQDQKARLDLFENILQGQPILSHEIMEDNGEWRRVH